MTVQAIIVRGERIASQIVGKGPIGPPGAQGPAGDVAKATNRTALAAIAGPSAGLTRFLVESGSEGTFVFSTADLSSEVAADPLQGVYVPPSSDTTGASGAWVRKYVGAADPRWFGAALDGTTDDKTAFTAAITVAGHVSIPDGKTLKTTGSISVPNGARICGPGTIDFDASGSSSRLFELQNDVSNVRITGLTINCASDVDFTHIVRMTQLAGTTLDGFDFCDNVINYTATPGSTADRWCIAGTGPGTRKNVRINRNILNGSMQLVATPVAVGTFQDSEICGNWITDARSNAISLLSAGDINAAYPCTLKNVKVTDNVIVTTKATNSTSIGIVVGIDASGSADKNVIIQNLTIARNYIDLSASSTKTADIYIRLGNKCAGIGGFDSVADNIVIDSNTITYGFSTTQNPISAATNSRITNFVFSNNKAINLGSGGDFVPRHLETGAKLIGNTFSIGFAMRLGENNGTIYSQGNIYSTLTNITNDAEFTWRSLADTYLGSASGTDRVCTFNANAGKVQKAEFDHCTIDSATTTAFGIRSAIYTVGAGAPTVHVRNLTSSTTWVLSLFEASTGSITAYGDSGTLSAANTWTANQTFSGSVKSTSATAGVGYATGAGGTVTQATSKSTGVTLNKMCGQITTHNAALAAGTIVSFVWTNSGISSGDLVVMQHIGGGTIGAYTIQAATPSNGQATVYIRNNTGGSLSEALILNFAVIKSVAA